MNKFLIGDLIYIPQSTNLYNDINRLIVMTSKSPIVATFLGRQDGTRMHKIDVYGKEMFLLDDDIETLNFARTKQDVHKNNSTC